MTYSHTTTRSSAENTSGKLSENRIWAEAGNSSSPSHRKKRSHSPGRNSRAQPAPLLSTGSLRGAREKLRRGASELTGGLFGKRPKGRE